MRYHDVRARLLRHDEWSSANSVFGDRRAHPEFPAVIVLDGERHSTVRSRIAEALDRERTDALAEQVVVPLVERVVEAALESDVDVVADVARPIAVGTISAMLGIEAEPWLEEATRGVVGMMGAQHSEGGSNRQAAYDRAVRELHAYFLDVCRDRPGAGVIHLLLDATRARRLTLRELLANCVLLTVAGTETTVTLLSGVVRRLAVAPELRSRLRHDLDARARFVEEVARLESPSYAFFRLGGSGEVSESTLLAPGHANRDPEIFPDPDSLRLDRRAPHLAFGWGAHYCLGAGLATAQASALLARLLEAPVNVEPLDPEVEFRPYPLIRQPVAFAARLRRGR